MVSQLPDSSGGGLAPTLENTVVIQGAVLHAQRAEIDSLRQQSKEAAAELQKARDRISALEQVANTLQRGAQSQGERLGGLDREVASMQKALSQNAWELTQLQSGLKATEVNLARTGDSVNKSLQWIQSAGAAGGAVLFILTMRAPIADLLKSAQPQDSFANPPIEKRD